MFKLSIPFCVWICGCYFDIDHLLFSVSKFTFMPEFDTTQIYINGSLKVGNTLKQTEEKVAIIEKVLLTQFAVDDDIDDNIDDDIDDDIGIDDTDINETDNSEDLDDALYGYIEDTSMITPNYIKYDKTKIMY